LRNRHGSGWLIGIGALGFLAVVILLTYGNYRYTSQNPGGNDFLVHWEGTRSFIINDLSPYSDATALRIQTLAYGRPANPGEHELRVAYPLYSIILFFPFALFGDFNFARALWMTVLEVSLVLMAILSIRVTEWRPNIVVLAVYLLFSLFWYNAVRPLINGNAVIIVALLLVAAFWAIREHADELAGVLLAFSTIKPQVVVLLLAFVVFYAAVNGRWRLIVWLVGTVVILSGAAMFLIPDWIQQNIVEVLRYPGYNPPGTPGAAMAVYIPAVGQKLGWAFTIGVALTLLVEWIAARKADFKGFLWAASLTLVLSPWSGIQNDPGNFIVLFPAVTMIFALLDDRWRRSGWMFSLGLIVVILVGLWWIFLNTLHTVNGQPQQSPVMFFPLPALLLVLLFWVRWWAFHPPNMWFDMLYERENPKL
jgi:hypothetical protein